MQKELLRTGLGLLRPCGGGSGTGGGFLACSTCSLNPSENEPVVLEAMEEMNGRPHGAHRYELVDLSEELSSDEGGNDVRGDDESGRGCFLRVLPARSHGGFFDAATRKLSATEGDNYQDIDGHRAEKEDSAIDHDKYQLVHTRCVDSTDGATIVHSISPSARRCRAKLVERMGSSAVVSAGVAVN